MSTNEDKGQTDARAGNEHSLTDLLDFLQKVVSETVSRMDAEKPSDHRGAWEFSSPDGKMRVDAGLRVNAVSSLTEDRTPASARHKARPLRSAPPQAAHRPKRSNRPVASEKTTSETDRHVNFPDCVTYSDGSRWHVCADIPGANSSDVSARIECQESVNRLVVSISGARMSKIEQDMPRNIVPETLSFECRNGVLDLSVDLLRDSVASDEQQMGENKKDG